MIAFVTIKYFIIIENDMPDCEFKDTAGNKGNKN